MKTMRVLLVGIAVLTCGLAATQDPPKPPAPRPQVFAAVFERGPAWDAQKSVLEQKGVQEHIRNNRSLGDKLIGAAPFTPTDEKDLIVGMVVLTAASREEAQTWLDRDPMIVDKVMTAKLRRWHVDALKNY